MTILSRTSPPTIVPRYFRSFSSYEIPFRPEEPLTFAETEGLRTFYVAYFDSAGNLVRFNKLQLVRATKELRTFSLPSPLKPGTHLYFTTSSDPATDKRAIGGTLEYQATEDLTEFFDGKVSTDEVTGEAVLMRKDIAFSDSYEYWPNGRLRKRVLTRAGQPPTVSVFDQHGCRSTDRMAETTEASFTHIPATGDWLSVLSAKSMGGLVYRIANHGPASVTLRCHWLKGADQVRELPLPAGNSIDVGANEIDCRVGPEFQAGATIEYRLVASPPLVCIQAKE